MKISKSSINLKKFNQKRPKNTKLAIQRTPRKNLSIPKMRGPKQPQKTEQVLAFEYDTFCCTLPVVFKLPFPQYEIINPILQRNVNLWPNPEFVTISPKM